MPGASPAQGKLLLPSPGASPGRGGSRGAQPPRAGFGLDFPEGLRLLMGTDIAPALILPGLPLKPTHYAHHKGLSCAGDCRLHPSRVQTGTGAGTPPRHTVPLNKCACWGARKGNREKCFPRNKCGRRLPACTLSLQSANLKAPWHQGR